MGRIAIQFELNGAPVSTKCAANTTLLHLLRDELGLTGTKEGCGVGECGACTVLLDGKAVNSCLVMAGSVSGHRVTTIEGVSAGGELAVLQQAFVQAGAVQCGFCTPGMILVAKQLLDESPHPSIEEIRTAVSGNLCRCTGYAQIVEAIQMAAREMQTGG